MSPHRKRRAIRDTIQALREVLIVVADMLSIVVAGAFAICTIVLIVRGSLSESVCSALCMRCCCPPCTANAHSSRDFHAQDAPDLSPWS
jgi:hypothetical protein